MSDDTKVVRLPIHKSSVEKVVENLEGLKDSIEHIVVLVQYKDNDVEFCNSEMTNRDLTWFLFQLEESIKSRALSRHLEEEGY